MILLDGMCFEKIETFPRLSISRPIAFSNLVAAAHFGQAAWLSRTAAAAAAAVVAAVAAAGCSSATVTCKLPQFRVWVVEQKMLICTHAVDNPRL